MIHRGARTSVATARAGSGIVAPSNGMAAARSLVPEVR
jgi:delta-aminolevulinic acid dehydratase/porphobilinogen synthase